MPSKRTQEVAENGNGLASVLRRTRGRCFKGDEPVIKVEMEEAVGPGAVKRIKVKEEKVEEQVRTEDDTIKKEDDTIKKEEVHREATEALPQLETIKQEEIETELAKLLAIKSEPVDFLRPESHPPNLFPSVPSADVDASQPKDWEKIYNSIVEMRKLIVTPVDSMGCERMPDTITPGLSGNNAKLYRFQLLISLMLSSQTKDEVNYSAMVRLNSHFTQKGYPSLCLEACLEATEAELDECIKQVGFHRRKATFIKKTCEIVKDKFDGDIPKTIEEIVTFPGVGPKMGHLLLQNGWGINLGIGVDVHLHRLAQMWRWVPKSDKPEATRLALEEWLPRKYWADVNPLLVGFGQTVCVPRAPNCDVCFLASSGLCRGVNRKLAKAEITEARLAKLGKQRGNLLKLVGLRR